MGATELRLEGITLGEGAIKSRAQGILLDEPGKVLSFRTQGTNIEAYMGA